jgi:hypothetical protein
MQIDDAYPSRFLKASDIGPHRPVVTIASVGMESFEGGKSKPVVFFREAKKGLVCNKTNFSLIVEITGEKDTSAWPGKQIRLYVAKVDMKGQLTDAIRVEAPPSRQATPAPAAFGASTEDVPF